MLQSWAAAPAVPDGGRGHGTCRDSFAKHPKKALGHGHCPQAAAGVKDRGGREQDCPGLSEHRAGRAENGVC